MCKQTFRSAFFAFVLFIGALWAAPSHAAVKPTFIDSAALMGPLSTMTISKNFATGGEHNYLIYTFETDLQGSASSVTWNGTPMVQLNAPIEYLNRKIYIFGLANPAIGASHDAVATVSSGGTINSGALLLYAEASAFQSDDGTEYGSGSGTEVIGSVSTTVSNSVGLLIFQEGNDSGGVTPGGNASLRAIAQQSGTQTFAVVERGPFDPSGQYSVSSTFSAAGYHYVTIPLVPAEAPTFVDSVSMMGPMSTLVLSKNFTSDAAHTYLLYTFETDLNGSASSVTWNGTPMAQLNDPVEYSNRKIYVFGLANPAIGASHDAVAVVSPGGTINSGALLLYSGASSTQLNGDQVYGSGSGGEVIGTATTTQSNAMLLLIFQEGNDDGVVSPEGDAALRAIIQESGKQTFAVVEEGVFEEPDSYSVSATFDAAGYHYAVVALAPAE